MLIDELNHRVKNTLATVQSIVWQASRANSDPQVIREAVESRLFALSRSHNLLTRENWHSAGLLDVLHDALEPFGVTDGRAERLVIAGENIRLSTRAALALGIAFNELATNAVKYGAFSNDRALSGSTGRSSRRRRIADLSCPGERRTVRRLRHHCERGLARVSSSAA